MPRNVSDIYFIPPGTEGFPDTTIESEKYNNYIHDVETDLNRPRPISAGGTGADDADEALANLHAEKAGQVVTNFDSHVWMAGSFYSTISATAPPVAGHAFSGIAHITDANNMVVEAVDLTDPLHKSYMRVKTAGVWGAWEGISIVTCADDPPTGNRAADNALWWESTTGLLFIRYNDGDSSQWTIACPQPDISTYAIKADVDAAIDGKVAKSGDTMDGPLILPPDEPIEDLQAVTKQYVDDRIVVAADALSYSGLQINGSMEISQEYGLAAVINNASGFVIDGWNLFKSGPSVLRAAQNPMWLPTMGVGLFPYSLSFIATTPEASLASGSYAILQQAIEGWTVNKLGWGHTGAVPITIGFWSSNSHAGTYTVAISNGAVTRSYCATYTQAVSAVPQYNVITIPGDTNSGFVWEISNGVGMRVSFTSAAGASAVAPVANDWQSGNYLAAPGQVNGIAALNDQLLITGVVILPGVQPLTAERSVFTMRSYDQELMLCQRYWFRDSGHWQGKTGYITKLVITFPVSMRTNPTCALSNISHNSDFFGFFIPEIVPNHASVAWETAGSGSDAFINLVLTANARL